MNKFKIGDLPIGFTNNLKLALQKSDSFHKSMLSYTCPELIDFAESDFNLSDTGSFCKADIWSTGCVFYEVIEHKKLFENPSIYKLCMKITQGDRDQIEKKHYKFFNRILDKYNKQIIW